MGWTLEKCAQWCNDIQNCRSFLYRGEDFASCWGYSTENCPQEEERYGGDLYAMNTCVNFDAPSQKITDNGNFLISQLINFDFIFKFTHAVHMQLEQHAEEIH